MDLPEALAEHGVSPENLQTCILVKEEEAAKVERVDGYIMPEYHTEYLPEL